MKNSDLPTLPALTATEIAYGRFVPHQFLRLMGRPSIEDVRLGDNVEQEMTLLFSDIRDFTALSESMLPAENFRFINSYLSTMEPMVTRHNGIVDKFIGDGIMALFSGSADDGLCSAIDMLRQLTIYNQGRSRAGYNEIKIGIGVNTGLVMMGTIGGHNRMDGTVIGDAVNLASRIESLTKIYSTPLVISDHTLHALKDRQAYCVRFLDRLQIKGRYQAQTLYEVFDADPEPLKLAKQRSLADFEHALAYYHLGREDLALPLLQNCLCLAPDDQAVQTYLERCRVSHRRQGGDAIDLIDRGIDWRDEYSIGIAEIDARHQDLVAKIALLAKQVGLGAIRLDPLLDGLVAAVDCHFAAEEAQMLDRDYPFIKLHRAQHDTIRRFVAEVRQEILADQQDRLYMVFRIQLLLVDSLITHITKSDFHLGNFLRRVGVV